jgi:hypothetical protein
MHTGKMHDYFLGLNMYFNDDGTLDFSIGVTDSKDVISEFPELITGKVATPEEQGKCHATGGGESIGVLSYSGATCVHCHEGETGHTNGCGVCHHQSEESR